MKNASGAWGVPLQKIYTPVNFIVNIQYPSGPFAPPLRALREIFKAITQSFAKKARRTTKERIKA